MKDEEENIRARGQSSDHIDIALQVLLLQAIPQHDAPHVMLCECSGEERVHLYHILHLKH